jgi:glycosyltransferase involved in cell wall biosynthesis
MRITRLPKERVATIHNPVFRSDITLLSSERLDHPWLVQRDIPVVVGAGKLKPQKDFKTLLRAFAIVRQQRPVKLIICGEGRERDSLMGLARELGIETDVDLIGSVRNLYAVLARASVFVLSSAWEGLPNVLIEALACGCPVVSTDCPSGPAEILDNGAFGRLVPVGDAIRMADAIRQTLEAPPTKEGMVARAKCFSFDDAMIRYEQVLTGRDGIDREVDQAALSGVPHELPDPRHHSR